MVLLLFFDNVVSFDRVEGRIWNNFLRRTIFDIRKCVFRGENDEDRLPRITANVHALRPNAEIIRSWETDVLLLHETKLAPHAIGEVRSIVKQTGWHLIHGKPCDTQGPRANTKRTHAATEATSGGVGILTRTPNMPTTSIADEVEPILFDSGR